MAYDPKKKVDLDKLRSVRVAGSAMPTRTPPVVRENQERTKRWEKDHAAYKRLRKEGLQPPKIDGSADRESKAVEKHEVEGKPSPKLLDRAMDAVS